MDGTSSLYEVALTAQTRPTRTRGTMWMTSPESLHPHGRLSIGTRILPAVILLSWVNNPPTFTPKDTAQSHCFEFSGHGPEKTVLRCLSSLDLIACHVQLLPMAILYDAGTSSDMHRDGRHYGLCCQSVVAYSVCAMHQVWVLEVKSCCTLKSFSQPIAAEHVLILAGTYSPGPMLGMSYHSSLSPALTHQCLVGFLSQTLSRTTLACNDA